MTRKSDEEKKALPKGYSLIKIARFCFLILIVVLLLWMVYNFREDINLDNFLRFVSYLDTDTGSPGGVEFLFPSSNLSRFAAFKNGLAALTPDGLIYLNPVGREELEVKQSFGKPALRVNDRRMLAYDIGGKAMVMSTDYSLIMNKMADYPIINARLNAQNFFTLVTSDNGYKAGVTVYNDKQRRVYRWRTSEYYLLDASLSPDSKRMAACGFLYSDGEIVSKVFGFTLTSDQIAWEYHLEGGFAVAVNHLENDKIVLLTETALIFLDAGGGETARFDFDGMTLKGYSDEGRGFLTLLLARNRVGSLNLLLTLDYSGEILGERETDEVISIVRAKGERVATLSPDGVKAFGKALTIEGLFSDYSLCQDIQIGGDGRLFAISSGSAERILE